MNGITVQKMHRAFIHEIKIECTQNDFASYFEVQNS